MEPKIPLDLLSLISESYNINNTNKKLELALQLLKQLFKLEIINNNLYCDITQFKSLKQENKMYIKLDNTDIDLLKDLLEGE